MARYHFDVLNGIGHVSDEEGQEFGSLTQAYREVRRILSDLARDELDEKSAVSFTVTMRDGDGRHVYEASLIFAERWLSDLTSG